MNHIKFIPNKRGLPVEEKEAGEVQLEMYKWMNRSEKVKCRDLDELPYWRAKSHCNML